MASNQTHSRSRPGKRVIVALVLLLTAGLVSAPTQAAEPPDDRSFTTEPLVLTDRATGAKAPSARYAQSDPDLLASTSDEITSIAVKLDYDAYSSYTGGLHQLEATSPSATGGRLNLQSKAAKTYGKHIQTKEDEFLAGLSLVAPEAQVGQRLRVVYGGVALRVPANKAAAIAKLPGVLAVQRDSVHPVLTDSSNDFIGSPALWEQLGGKDNAGAGVVVGILDTGAWPEHASFADDGSLPAPPPKGDGTPRTCAFGDNPLTDEVDPFACNNKLIGGQAFLETGIANGDEAPLPTTGRDFDGHGTHTASTSAGIEVDDVELLGVNRGSIRGVAPGAHLSIYRVCGTLGCFSTDSAAATGQAILDGVKVINFSVGGGSQPYSEPSELAFLDAFDAGVFVATSAGNSGPGASTTEHLGGWTMTVAASTQDRAFDSTVTLTSGTDSIELHGSTVTQGIDTPTPVVVAADVAGYTGGDFCEAEAPAGLFAGKIVVCQRGVNARVEKGFNVLQGGAVGMLLYNPQFQDTETDNHWLPTVHLPGPEGIVEFLEAHPTDTLASFTAGTPITGAGNVMAGFSSRGPNGNILKPDITAPGVQILAGDSPAATDIVGGPPGSYQAIAGTSMSSPHVAGSGALLAALHPEWTPGQIKSALMTTARTNLVKEDEETPADPFDFGAGHIDLTVAGDPGITFSETTERMLALGNDEATAIDMNLPSVYAPRLPGRISTIRTAFNSTDETLTFDVGTSTTVDGSTIEVSPASFTVAPGASQDLAITISAVPLTDGTSGFGQITLTQVGGARTLHLPVAFTRAPGDVTLEQSCNRESVGIVSRQAICTVTARNTSLEPVTADLQSVVSDRLGIWKVTGATKTGRRTARAQFELGPRIPGTPSIAPGASPAGFVPLQSFGVDPVPVGDEDILNFDVPAFQFAGEEWASMGVTSNGYLVVGGGTTEDVDFVPQELPNPIPPNNVLAPFWTDANGEGAPGIRATLLTDDVSGDSWIVVEWDLFVFGTTTPIQTQVWIGVNGDEDITYTYAAAPDPLQNGLTVGAENFTGLGGADIDTLPTQDYRITSTAATPGGSQSYSLTIRGREYGWANLITTMVTEAVRGETVVKTPLPVRRR